MKKIYLYGKLLISHYLFYENKKTIKLNLKLFLSFLKPEISKTEEIIELESPSLNILIPRLIPKESPRKSSPKNYFKKNLYQEKEKNQIKKKKVSMKKTHLIHKMILNI